MSTPAQQPQTRDQVLAALAVALASQLTPVAAATLALPLLAQLGVAPAQAVAVLALALPKFAPLPLVAKETGPAALRSVVEEAVMRARYLDAAGRRFQSPEWTVAQERRHLAAHLAAQASRTRAAAQVDKAVRSHGMLLGWRAILDERTDPICRRLAGTNFHVDAPPLGSYPGTLHGGTCRCRAVGPFPGARLAADALGVGEALPDVIPFAVELTERIRSALHT